MTQKIRISSRRSDLARLQSYAVGEALRTAHPGLEVEYFFKESLGDQNQNDPLWKLPTKGVFTEDFVEDLRQGRTDLVVHSWKDLPTEARPGLALYGTLPRADTRDVFFLREEKPELTLLTSSPRRTFSAERALKELLPFPVRSLTTKPVRGNVVTRLRKLAEGEGDGLFMAKAALDRLLTAPQEEFLPAQRELRQYMAGLRWMVLPLSLFPTAPAQGALAIEGAAGREDLAQLLQPLHCFATERAVAQERKLFSSFGGGCHQKIGLTVEEHPELGTLQFFHGALDSGEIRHRIEGGKLYPSAKSRWPLKSTALFRRETLTTNSPGTDLFVARAEALPMDWKIEKEIVWTAGVETWKKLSRRGLWVHGTSDGLGETLPSVAALAGRPAHFTKLTHDASENDGIFPVHATYHLAPLPQEIPDAESYFWMSASSFRRALELKPGLRAARHATGPGFTAKAVEKILGRPVEVYINYQHWKSGDPLGK